MFVGVKWGGRNEVSVIRGMLFSQSNCTSTWVVDFVLGFLIKRYRQISASTQSNKEGFEARVITA